MPIWSLTAERLDKLNDAIARKKGEHDDLLAKSEKDLWCSDLDEFTVEWENQLALDAEIQTNIRRMGRRVSQKIGAGRNRKPKDDDDYEPEKKTKGKGRAKAAPKAETKSSQRFAEMFSAKPKTKKEPKQETSGFSEDNFSDDDFAALSRSKPAAAPKASQSQSVSASQSEDPDAGRTKRAAASKARKVFELSSDSDDDYNDNLLGDIGDMVKGIGKTEGESSGRLSLYAMNRPESSHGNGGSSGLPKLKTKASRSTFDVDSPDETNYELLAKSSPHKIDSFLSDDDPIVPQAKAASAKASSSTSAGLATVKKARGRPAGSKNKVTKAEPKAKAAPKATTLSPAAKAYAAKKGVKKSVLAALGDSDVEMAGSPSPVSKPAARGRPGRAAAAKRRVVVDPDSSMDLQEEEDSDDPFEMDDYDD